MINGKPKFYEPAELKAVRAKFAGSLAPYAPDKPIQGPIRLVTKWLFPIKGKHRNGEYKTSKPDTDNLVKMLKDVMTDLHYWKDDAQVASEIIEKFWSEKPGLYVCVKAIEECCCD